MTSPVSAIEAIEKAMEGVTPGPWEVKTADEWSAGFDFFAGQDGAFVFLADVEPVDAAFIAACNPVAMREVLALARQAEALQRENAEKDARIAALEEALRPFAAIEPVSVSTSDGHIASAAPAHSSEVKMQSELKPCPFCGSDKQMLLSPTCDRSTPYNPADRAFPVIRCGGCYTDVPGRDFDASGKSAVEAWNRRAALSAEQALPIRVKPMEWRREAPYHVARVFGNVYAVEAWDGGVTLSGIPGHRDFKTVEAAKAAAQSDYETRIRAALVDVPAVEPVAKQWCAYENGQQHTSWYPDGYGDRAGWEALAKRNPGKYQIVTRDLFAHPPLREGEDSAEVGRALEFVALWAWREDPPAAARNLSDAERLSAIKYHPTIKALAATRSGSATTAKGCAE